MEPEKSFKIGNLKFDAFKTKKENIYCCVWYPFKDNEDCGLCWDFKLEDIDDIIKGLTELKSNIDEYIIEDVFSDDE